MTVPMPFILHQQVFDRTYRSIGYHLRVSTGALQAREWVSQPNRLLDYLAVVTSEILLRAQVSAIQRNRAGGHTEALYFLDVDVLTLLQAPLVTDLQEAGKTLAKYRATLTLHLHDAFDSLLFRSEQTLLTETVCSLREAGVRIALGTRRETRHLVRLLQNLGQIDYLFLGLGGVQGLDSPTRQSGRFNEMRDIMMRQIEGQGLCFVASGVNTRPASELAQFLPFAYWLGSYLSAEELI